MPPVAHESDSVQRFPAHPDTAEFLLDSHLVLILVCSRFPDLAPVLTSPTRSFIFCIIALAGVACSQEAAKQRHFEQGERLFAAGQFAEAVVEFRNAVSRDDTWGEARFKLAEAYAASGSPERAFQEYVRAADLMPDDELAQVRAAGFLVQAGQYEDGKTRVDRLLARNPSHVEALVIRGNALAGLRDLEGAVAQMAEAIAVEPGRSHSYMNLGMVHQTQGATDEARAAFLRAVELEPRSLPARRALANFYWSVGDVAAAERVLTETLAIDPADLVTNQALATFYMAAERAAEAEPYVRSVADTTRTPEARLQLADYYLAYGRPDQARQVLEPLSLETATRDAAETRLASVLYSEDRIRDAHRMLDGVIARAPNHAHALLLKARWLLAEGQPDEALKSARMAVAASPQMIAALYVRGVAEARTRRTSDAIKSFSEVLRLNPQAAEAQVQLSRLHLARGSVESAVLLAEEALGQTPDSLDARLALVRAWITRGDVNRARAELVRIRAQAPDAADVIALEGSLHRVTGNAAAARTAFERALRLDANSLEALVGLVALDLQQSNVRQARATLEPRLASGPADVELLLLAARVFVAGDDLAAAEDVLRRAIELDPLGIESYRLLVPILRSRQKLDGARAEFEQIAAATPRHLAARVMVALILHAQGKPAEAKRWYMEALQIEPRMALAANNLASIHADAGENLDYALQLAESAIEQLPTNPDIRDTLGWVYHRKQLHGLAVRQFQQSVAAAPDNAMFLYHLGLAHAHNGEPEAARHALEKALALNPSFTEAQQALASLGQQAR
jgi:putative PEP-CTERM system TPR-repeat lipoprotein